MGEAKRRRDAIARGEPDPGPSRPTPLNNARHYRVLPDGTREPVPGRVVAEMRKLRALGLLR